MCDEANRVEKTRSTGCRNGCPAGHSASSRRAQRAKAMISKKAQVVDPEFARAENGDDDLLRPVA